MNQETGKNAEQVATSVQSIVIQPCPFCGSEAKRFRNAGTFWFVACANAFCKMRPESTAYYKVQKAIDDWNQRSRMTGLSGQIMDSETTPTGTPVDRIVMRLFQLSATWAEKASKVDGDWYNDSAAYTECSDELEDLAKELMPRFECCWCRDYAVLPADEYTWDVTELGGWCVDKHQPICKECKWAADESAEC